MIIIIITTTTTMMEVNILMSRMLGLIRKDETVMKPQINQTLHVIIYFSRLGYCLFLKQKGPTHKQQQKKARLSNFYLYVNFAQFPATRAFTTERKTENISRSTEMIFLVKYIDSLLFTLHSVIPFEILLKEKL